MRRTLIICATLLRNFGNLLKPEGLQVADNEMVLNSIKSLANRSALPEHHFENSHNHAYWSLYSSIDYSVIRSSKSASISCRSVGVLIGL